METPPQPPTNDELLVKAGKFADWAMNLYAQENDLANTAALVSLAGSALVIARSLAGHQLPVEEMAVPEITSGNEEA
jgi:hypothetical protein